MSLPVLCLNLIAVAGFDCRTVWPDDFSTVLTAFYYKEYFVSISQTPSFFFSNWCGRVTKSAEGTFLSQRKDVQTGLFVCLCVFMLKFFTAFVIMALVFLLFVVLSCACDYLCYKRDPRCCERDRSCYERDRPWLADNFITHPVMRGYCK